MSCFVLLVYFVYCKGLLYHITDGPLTNLRNTAQVFLFTLLQIYIFLTEYQ